MVASRAGRSVVSVLRGPLVQHYGVYLQALSRPRTGEP